MTVTLPAVPAPAPAAPSLWTLGLEAQELQRQIETLALQLDADDETLQQAAEAELTALLEASHGQAADLERKADAYCWVIENLRGVAQYRSAQAARLADLAAADLKRAERLESALITVLTTLHPDSTKFSLPAHELTSRRSEAAVIDDADLLPPDLLHVKTSTSPDKKAIKAALKAGETVPGAHLEQRRSWSIR